MMKWILPNTSLTAEKRLPVLAFRLPSNSDYKPQLLSFRFLQNRHQHTPYASPFFYLYIYPSFFASLSQLSLTSVAHDIAICFHPSQASVPFLVQLMCLSCLSPCQSFSIPFMLCTILCLKVHLCLSSCSALFFSAWLFFSSLLWITGCRTGHLHVSLVLPAE